MSLGKALSKNLAPQRRSHLKANQVNYFSVFVVCLFVYTMAMCTYVRTVLVHIRNVYLNKMTLCLYNGNVRML